MIVVWRQILAEIGKKNNASAIAMDGVQSGRFTVNRSP